MTARQVKRAPSWPARSGTSNVWLAPGGSNRRTEFEQLLRYANPLGLYAEEFDAHAHHLGNTPQALSHLALISAASFLTASWAVGRRFGSPDKVQKRVMNGRSTRHS